MLIEVGLVSVPSISTGWEVGVLFVLFQNHLWGDVVVSSCILKVFWFMDDRL